MGFEMIFIFFIGLVLILIGGLNLRKSLNMSHNKTYKIPAKVIDVVMKRENETDEDGTTYRVKRYYPIYQLMHPISKTSITHESRSSNRRKPRINSSKNLSVKVLDDASLDIQENRFVNSYLVPVMLIFVGLFIILGSLAAL